MRAPAAALLALFILVTGCTGGVSGSSSTSHARAQHLATKTLTIYASDGRKVRVKAEIADTGPEREKGLMYRTSMPENHGMLFVFDHPAVLRFWMKNTLIPLSVAFIDSKGRIVDIQSMEPRTETVHSSKKPARYALEMNQGFFRKHHIEVGDRVELPE
ncbi:DUF192 domain-containing protein [Rubrobacter calidifluminis]|uniref:DUF192 domain-containing protein n=1 Tax=Rubrobacter calidifluminis TaxID=1392640 RepID=UPI00235E14CE|nr:DUF192 domain-containing protein [Rubrobacter calidifluminis]